MTERNYPDLIEAWMEYYSTSSAPDSYQRWAFVSAIAGALERKVWLMRDADTGWYPNLYLFLVGPAGSGKSTVAESAMTLLQEVEGIDFLLNDLNESSLFHDLSAIGKAKRFVFNGISFAHSAATIFASEAAETFVEQYRGGGIINRLVSLYNGGPLGWSLKHGVGRSTRSDGKIMLLNPCVNLLACSTPEWLITKCMTKNDAAGGFGSRILLVVSNERLKDSSSWTLSETSKDIARRIKIVEDLRKIAQMRGPYTTSACFNVAWEECQTKYAAWMDARKSIGMLGGYQQRKMTQLYKVTMCIAAARRQELLLKGEDIRTAWEMLEAIEPAMVSVLDDMEMSPDAKARRDIYDYLLRHDVKEITKAEIVRDFPKFNFDQINVAIQGLVVMGRLEAITRGNRTVFQVKQL